MLSTLVAKAMNIKGITGVSFLPFKLAKQKINLILSKYWVGQVMVHHT